MPEPMPIDTATRPSASVRSRRRASSEPKPAEICAVGPSRPAEPPEPIVSALETIFTSTTRARMARGSLCTASMALSVPWPSASGANLATIHAETNAPPVVIRGIAHQRGKPVLPASPPSPAAVGTS
jgi:hypothetical protein